MNSGVSSLSHHLLPQDALEVGVALLAALMVLCVVVVVWLCCCRYELEKRPLELRNNTMDEGADADADGIPGRGSEEGIDEPPSPSSNRFVSAPQSAQLRAPLPNVSSKDIPHNKEILSLYHEIDLSDGGDDTYDCSNPFNTTANNSTGVHEPNLASHYSNGNNFNSSSISVKHGFSGDVSPASSRVASSHYLHGDIFNIHQGVDVGAPQSTSSVQVTSTYSLRRPNRSVSNRFNNFNYFNPMPSNASGDAGATNIAIAISAPIESQSQTNNSNVSIKSSSQSKPRRSAAHRSNSAYASLTVSLDNHSSIAPYQVNVL